MLTSTLHISFLSFLLFSTTNIFTATTTPPTYIRTDYFLLDCGSSSTTTSFLDGRTWDGDTHSKFSPTNISTTSEAFTASSQDPSVSQVPYSTARFFHSPFTYTFPVSPGPKFLRLYFYPSDYSNLDKTKSFFSVTANDEYTLLSNFSAFLTVSVTDPSLIKEFVIHIRENQSLNITFSPSLNSYAFINGMEVVSIPENHYIRGPTKLVNQNNLYFIDNNTSLETLYRLNVGGNAISITNDSGMFRAWYQDEKYIYSAGVGFTPYRDIPIRYTQTTPPYTAPDTVYKTTRTMGNFSLLNNLTWNFPVDSGFFHLLRLHFCEIQLEITLPNQRVFNIFINNQTAEREADVISWTGGTGIPVFRDYVIWVVDPDGRRSKQDLWLAMYPALETKPQYGDAILNGLEIFKLNGTDGSLAGSNAELVLSPPPPEPYTTPPEKKSKAKPLLPAVIGGVAGGCVFLLVLGLLAFRRRRKVKYLSGSPHAKSSSVPILYTSKSTKTSGGSPLPSDLCRRFSLEEIIAATSYFDENFVIGLGGFGIVYKGYIDNGATKVAIKRLNPESNQGAREFLTEIGLLSKLRHVHLVSLIGYCNDNREMILVYDHMARGTVRDHLYKTKNPPLKWKQRLQICIGAAQGLHYLHAGAERTIIHRDVKSTNILLDEKWVAKVSDFGLSKLGPQDVGHTHVSTEVKGSFGYVDPEYFRLNQLTEKSDVYSLGVVLFEVLCARAPIIPNLPTKEQVNLAEWAQCCYKRGTLDQIVDSNIIHEIAPECLRKFGEVADSCLRDNSIERPGMGDVVWGLEFALQLQEAAEKLGQACGLIGNSSPSVLPFLLHKGEETTSTDDIDHVFSTSKSSGTSTVSSAVFSEMKYPAGR